jgi:hypothetical protein
MKKVSSVSRPNCDEILAEKKKWAYKFKSLYSFIREKADYNDVLEKSHDVHDNFALYFIQTKYNSYYKDKGKNTFILKLFNKISSRKS